MLITSIFWFFHNVHHHMSTTISVILAILKFSSAIFFFLVSCRGKRFRKGSSCGKAASGLERILCGLLVKGFLENMDRCTGLHNRTEMILKKLSKPFNKSISIRHIHVPSPIDNCDNFLLNPFPNKPWFLRVCSTSLLKTLWEKDKLLVTSNFSFSHRVFYLFGKLSAIFIEFEIVVCKLFQFGRV